MYPPANTNKNALVNYSTKKKNAITTNKSESR